MKRGFALLETMIVITFLSVSMLLLYGSFSNMVENSKKNIAYDDASHIYDAYYLKEYLLLHDQKGVLKTDSIKEITCNDFLDTGCVAYFKKLKIHKVYLVKYDFTDIRKEDYSSMLVHYLETLSNVGEYDTRLILEIENQDTYQYSSIGLRGEAHE